MARTNISEVTDGQAIVTYTRKFFRAAYAEAGPVPGALDGDYAFLVAIAHGTELSEAQMDALETAIEGLTGVTFAKVLIGPARIPLDRVPVNNDLYIGVEGSFDIRPEEV